MNTKYGVVIKWEKKERKGGDVTGGGVKVEI